jgi:hypothetical protein
LLAIYSPRPFSIIFLKVWSTYYEMGRSKMYNRCLLASYIAPYQYTEAGYLWLTSVILPTMEAEIRRTEVQSK